MHAEFSYAYFEWLFNVHTHHCTENHGIYQIRCNGKRVALFVNRPMALQCRTLKYRHKDSMYTMESLVAPLNKSATFIQAPCSTKLMF